jgi:hypothetical protein
MVFKMMNNFPLLISGSRCNYFSNSAHTFFNGIDPSKTENEISFFIIKGKER